jgi:predicted RNA-binding Zn ribbon-like protein
MTLDMTARQIIEARIGKKLPRTRDLPPDLRRAIKGLAIAKIKAKETAQ